MPLPFYLGGLGDQGPETRALPRGVEALLAREGDWVEKGLESSDVKLLEAKMGLVGRGSLKSQRTSRRAGWETFLLVARC